MNQPKKEAFVPGPDEKLLARFVAGDHGALRELTVRFERGLLSFVERRLMRKAPWLENDADQVATDVWGKVSDYGYTYQGCASFWTWLTAVAAQTCSRHAETAFKRREVQAEDTTEGVDWLAENKLDDGPSVDEIAEQREAFAAAEQALASISREKRELLRLRLLDGLEWEEIAARLGKPRTTLIYELGSTLRKLQSQMRGHLPEGRGSQKRK